MIDRFIRKPETSQRTGLSPSTLWRLERAGKFPKRRKLSSNAVGHLESEVAEWQQDPEGWAEKYGKEAAA
jgi:prophage regulatory protein